MPLATDQQRLQRHDFTFHGFDQLHSELDEYLNDVWIRSGEPDVQAVENAVFIPASETSFLGQYEGALLTADGQTIATALSHRRFSAPGHELLGALSRPVPLRPSRIVEEEVVYLGWLIDHFGHILLESVSRTWILNTLDPSVKAIFHIHRNLELSPTAWRILEAFGIPRERILVLDEQTMLRRVVVPEALYEISYAAHVRAPVAYREVASSIVSGGDRCDQPVYLSRRLLSSRLRPIVGEFEMEEVLRENGFLIVHPESMSFDDQVRLVNRHRDIFTSAGSAAYLPLFSLQSPQIHILTTGIPFHDYFLVPKILGANAYFCNCFTGDNHPSRYFLPPVLKMAMLAEYLDARGLLKSRQRALLAARMKDFRPESDELRLLGYVQHYATHRWRLNSAIEAEAEEFARSSWPLCWVLARYFLVHDHGQVEDYVRRFLALAEAESDIGRLVKFQPDIKVGSGKINRNVQRETSDRLTRLLMDRFFIDLVAEKARRQEERRAKQSRAGNAASGQAATPISGPRRVLRQAAERSAQNA